MRDGTRNVVMAQLSERIDAIDRLTARSRTGRLAADLDAIRVLAAANGFAAVSPVIHALEAALSRGERGPAVDSGLVLLRDAVKCGGNPRSGAVLAAAACSLRIAG